jgi:dinuclear metal center YbgI/SA1388 family protein
MEMNEIKTSELADWMDRMLSIERFKDYCPNGLQVEGKPSIRHVVSGVTASEALLREAIAQHADAILVHHGWFWKNEDPRIRGPKRVRLSLALAHGINVFAYHLPLDAHPEFGNNIQLARVLGIEPERRADQTPVTFGPDGLVWSGHAPGIDTLGALAHRVASRLGRAPLVIGDPEQPVRRIAWCTGGAQGMMADAVEAKVDTYITGEASEPTTHLARETGVGFIGAGHHATERYGVQALGAELQAQFGLRVTFIDIDNPV